MADDTDPWVYNYDHNRRAARDEIAKASSQVTRPELAELAATHALLAIAQGLEALNTTLTRIGSKFEGGFEGGRKAG